MSSAPLALLVALAVAVGLFLVLRDVVLWYFKIHTLVAAVEAQVKILEEVRSLLRVIARSELEIRDLARGDDPPLS